MAMEVNPETLLFTQDSIKNTFKAHDDERIDDAVDSLLEGSIEASDFPRLNVVAYDGRQWSLDNRRLWVFKKARIQSITLQLVSYNQHPRFRELIERNRGLQKRILQPGYWPRVRGPCRQEFPSPVARYSRFNPKPAHVHQPKPKSDTVVNPTSNGFAYGGSCKDSIDWPLPGQKYVSRTEFDRDHKEKLGGVESDASTRLMRDGNDGVGVQPTPPLPEIEKHAVTSPMRSGRDNFSGTDTGVSTPPDSSCREYGYRLENDLTLSPPEVPVVVDILHDSPHPQNAVEDRPAGFVPDHRPDASYEEEKPEGYPFFSAHEAVVNILDHDASYGQDGVKGYFAPCAPATSTVANATDDTSHEQKDVSVTVNSANKISLDAHVDFDSAQNSKSPPGVGPGASGTDSSRSVSIWVKVYQNVFQRAKLVYQKSIGAAKLAYEKLFGGA